MSNSHRANCQGTPSGVLLGVERQQSSCVSRVIARRAIIQTDGRILPNEPIQIFYNSLMRRGTGGMLSKSRHARLEVLVTDPSEKGMGTQIYLGTLSLALVLRL